MPLMFLINAVGDPRTAGFLSYTLLCRNLKFLPLALFVKPPYAVPDTGETGDYPMILSYCSVIIPYFSPIFQLHQKNIPIELYFDFPFP